jgi:transglutaminase-like putative cysteine protease
VRDDALPADGQVRVEAAHGNRMLYVERSADAHGVVSLSVGGSVDRLLVTRTPVRNAAATTTALHPDAHVPVGGKGMALLAGRTLPKDPMALARAVYDAVNAHMTYRKDEPGWGTGDSDWAFGSGFGNCTDFHSLFISIMRGEGIPACFEIGYLLPEARGTGTVPGYHCWAKFSPDGQRWVPVDISEANRHPAQAARNFGTLTEDRVMLSRGRDLLLSPPQDGPPLNYFVYPYAEAAGKPVSPAQITHTFTYTDAAPPPAGSAIP